MSDNDDLLADDLGDHSLADYNLGNEEEDLLLADEYEGNSSQNVPSSVSSYTNSSAEYANTQAQYNEPIRYHMPPEPESVVPTITVEIPNTPLPEQSTYAPYEPPAYEQEVPPAIPAAPMESPQTVPMASVPIEDMGPRERFISERPPGAQRMPQVRDIPDTLDKVVLPRGSFPPRGRNTWRNPQFHARYNQYRRNNMHRGNFQPRPSFPPPRPNIPQLRPERPEIMPEIRPEIGPNPTPEMPMIPPEISPERPIMPDRPLPNPVPLDFPRPPLERPMERPMMDRPPMDRPPMDRPPMDRPPMDRPPMDRPPMDRPPMDRPPMHRPPMDPRFRFPNQFDPRFMRPHFERPMFFPPRPQFNPRFGPPMREITPNISHIPQVTIRHGIPQREPEVRMLPVQLPPNLPPGTLAGKKVLINPHFKGNFQPPVDGPIQDIDDAAERFIAEQRNALARAAARKVQRRSPQRYIENTTIQVENELCGRTEEEELLRRQEEFINANRAGLRRRMRSPSPVRRSPSPRRSPERRRPDRPPVNDEESEYKRRMREQESLRERVLRAKEVRRRKNAVAAQRVQDKERETERRQIEQERQQKEIENANPPIENQPKETTQPKPETAQPKPETTQPKPEIKQPEPVVEQIKPDTTKKSPEKEIVKERERSPVKEAEVNSTCESPPRTPPLLPRDSDDDLDLILGEFDDILSDDDDTGRFKSHKEEKSTPVTKTTKPAVDLRSKLPPKETKKPRQKIVFTDKEKEREREREERKRKDLTPPRKTIVSSSTKADESGIAEKKAKIQPKENQEANTKRQRIIFDKKETEVKKPDEKDQPKFSSRRVILQRNQTKEKSVFARIEVKTDPTKPNPGIFSRAVRTAIGSDKNRIVIKNNEPQIEYPSDSDDDEDILNSEVGNQAFVQNLPHGMTDTRLKTLAGNDVQSLILEKEERSAKISFKTTVAAETFKKKFNNKMVAASRLTVTLR